MKRLDLARLVNDVLELPIPDKKNIEQCLAMDIVNAVIKAMTAALQRGETIRVYGLGTFQLRTRKARRIGYTYYPHLPNHKKRFKVRLLKPKTYVHFTPSASILEELNGLNK